MLADSGRSTLSHEVQHGRELERRLRTADFAEVRHNLLRERETEVDELGHVLAKRLELWHKVDLRCGGVLDEVFEALGELPGSMVSAMQPRLK